MRESTFPLYLKECHECHFIISKDFALKYIGKIFRDYKMAFMTFFKVEGKGGFSHDHYFFSRAFQ